MKAWGLLVWVAFLLGAVRPARSAITVRCPDPEFSFELPDHFSRQPSSGNIIYFYTSSDPSDEVPDTLLNVERLHRTVGLEQPALPASAPPGSTVLISKWKRFELKVLANPTTVAGEPFVARTVQIPLADEAVKISVAMKADHAESIDAFLASVLRTFEGPSNWSAPLTRGDRAGFIAAGVIGVTLVGGLAAFGAIQNRRRKATPAALHAPNAGVYSRLTSVDPSIAALRAGIAAGVCALVLIASGVAFVIGFGPAVITDAKQRTTVIAEGALQASFFVGLIASTIVIIRRKRKRQRPLKRGPL